MPPLLSVMSALTPWEGGGEEGKLQRRVQRGCGLHKEKHSPPPLTDKKAHVRANANSPSGPGLATVSLWRGEGERMACVGAKMWVGARVKFPNARGQTKSPQNAPLPPPPPSKCCMNYITVANRRAGSEVWATGWCLFRARRRPRAKKSRPHTTKRTCFFVGYGALRSRGTERVIRGVDGAGNNEGGEGSQGRHWAKMRGKQTCFLAWANSEVVTADFFDANKKQAWARKNDFRPFFLFGHKSRGMRSSLASDVASSLAVGVVILAVICASACVWDVGGLRARERPRVF